jgi:hypothetical protein
LVSGLRVADVNFLRGVVHPAQQWPDNPLKTGGSAGQPQRMGDPVEVHFRYFPSPSLFIKTAELVFPFTRLARCHRL